MKEKKGKKNWWLIGFMIMIMVGTSFSFVFYGFSPSAEKVVYNGIKFTIFQDRIEAKINGKNAAFSFLPQDVLSINSSVDFNLLKNKYEIDSTYDYNSSKAQYIALAQHQMSLTLEQYGIFLRRGFVKNNTYNMPIITCSQASQNVPVIHFLEGNHTEIRQEGNCIVAEASKEAEFIKEKDYILYGILGVIK
ncbi:MAG TPA: hypothetical protein VI564_02475 [Candidatus Nanoarchaeia archaeon]|nr:hypothetical protein [Candidatus Nanoarchaeia archaeon]